MSRPSANHVIARHAPALLAREGVVGLWEGREPGGEPCLVVALDREDPAVRADLPASLEGYPLQVQVTGPLGPLRNPGAPGEPGDQ